VTAAAAGLGGFRQRPAPGRVEHYGCRAWRIRIVSFIRIHRHSLKFWLPPLIWIGVIFCASGDTGSSQHSSTLFAPLMHWLFPHMAPGRIEAIHYLFRKGAHLTEFAVLAVLIWQALRHSPRTELRPWRWAEAGLALGLVLLFAASDELHQAWVPGRTGQISDVMIDLSGGAIGLGLLWLAGKSFKRW